MKFHVQELRPEVLDTTEGNGGPGWEALDQVQMA